MHVGAFHAIREIEELVVYSLTARRAAFAEAGGRAADEPRDAVKGATVVLAAPARRAADPLRDYLRHARSSCRSDRRSGALEIDVSVVGWCDLIVCDDVDEAVARGEGDMLEATRAGVPFADKAVPSTHLANELDARLASVERPMFKSVGSGLQDVVVAGLILERRGSSDLRRPLPVEFLTKH